MLQYLKILFMTDNNHKITFILLLKSHLFPDKDAFEHSPQGKDSHEHEDLLPCVQLDGFGQRCS